MPWWPSSALPLHLFDAERESESVSAYVNERVGWMRENVE